MNNAARRVESLKYERACCVRHPIGTPAEQAETLAMLDIMIRSAESDAWLQELGE